VSHYDKDPCEHGYTVQHVVQSLRGGKFIGCYGGTPTEDAEFDFLDTQVRHNPHQSELNGAETGLAASGSHREEAMYFIFDAFGATSDAISQHMESTFDLYIPPNQVASRVGELVKGGWVQDSGQVALTRRKSEAIVWKFYKHLGYKNRADLPD